MNKIKVCFASIVLALASVGVSKAFFGYEPNLQIPAGLNYQTMTSSGTVFPRSGVVYFFYSSTGNGTTDWWQAFDTSAYVPAGGNNLAAFQILPSTQILTVPVMFTSTSVANNTGAGGNGGVDYRPYGVTVSSGLYIWMSNVQRSVTVGYTK